MILLQQKSCIVQQMTNLVSNSDLCCYERFRILSYHIYDSQKFNILIHVYCMCDNSVKHCKTACGWIVVKFEIRVVLRSTSEVAAHTELNYVWYSKLAVPWTISATGIILINNSTEHHSKKLNALDELEKDCILTSNAQLHTCHSSFVFNLFKYTVQKCNNKCTIVCHDPVYLISFFSKYLTLQL